MAQDAQNGIKVNILKSVEVEKESAKGHTYIHFGGDLKKRFKTLAELAGYNRKLNDFGVAIFEQALAMAEADVKAQIEQARKAASK